MEAEERPSKLQKVAHADEASVNGAGGEEQNVPVTETGAVNSDANANANGVTDGGGGGGGDGDGEGVAQAAAANQSTAGAVPPAISKSQMKKQKRQEEWEARRGWRRDKRKEKKAVRKTQRRQAREQAKEEGEKRGEGHDQQQEGSKDKAQMEHTQSPLPLRKARARSTLLPMSIVLDCDYDDLMLDKERLSLSSQIARCYSDNTRAPFRAHLFVSSFNKLLKERFDTILRKQYMNWKGVKFIPDQFVVAGQLAKQAMTTGPRSGALKGAFAGLGDEDEGKDKDKDKEPTETAADGLSLAEQGEVIYLSSDSSETLTELRPYCTYVVGGLVDKNRYKAVCYKNAVEHGVRTAKLPIGDYMRMDSRKVLTTNHVVEIMLRWLETKDWGKSFEMVLPKRKGGVMIGKADDGGDVEGKGDNEDEESHIPEGDIATAEDDEIEAAAHPAQSKVSGENLSDAVEPAEEPLVSKPHAESNSH